MFKLANWVPQEEFNKPMFNVDVPYEFSVVSIKDGFYNTGTPKFDLVLNIWKENGIQVPFKTTLYGGEAWPFYVFLKSIGADILWDKLKSEGIDLDSLKNRTGQLIFKVEEYVGNDGIKKSAIKVKKYIDKADAIKSRPPVHSEPFKEDDVPW